MSSERYALLQEEFVRIEPESLGPVFERVLGLQHFDAMRLAREARGLLAEQLESREAETLRDALAAEGLPVRLVPQELVVRIGKPILSRNLVFRADGLYVEEGFSGRLTPLPWPNLFFISAGEIRERREKPIRLSDARAAGRLARRTKGLLVNLAGPIFGRLIFNALEIREPGRSSGRPGRANPLRLADVFASTASGEALHLRLRAPDLYYEQILGPEFSRDVKRDFARVLARLCTQAERAMVGPAARALILSGSDPGLDASEAQFGEETEFTAYNRWQIQMMLLEPAGGGGASAAEPAPPAPPPLPPQRPSGSPPPPPPPPRLNRSRQ